MVGIKCGFEVRYENYACVGSTTLVKLCVMILESPDNRAPHSLLLHGLAH